MVPSLPPRRAAIAGAIVVAALATIGCGSPQAPRLDAASRDRLQQTIADARAAATAGDRSGALDALSTLSQLVAREAGAGHLSAPDAAALRTGVARARQRASAEIALPAAAPAPVQSAPAPAPAPPAVAAKPQQHLPPGKRDKPRGGKGKGHKR
jgi:hypothetical protein